MPAAALNGGPAPVAAVDSRCRSPFVRPGSSLLARRGPLVVFAVAAVRGAAASEVRARRCTRRHRLLEAADTYGVFVGPATPGASQILHSGRGGATKARNWICRTSDLSKKV